MKWIRLIVLSWMLALVATAQVLQPVNLGTAINDGTGDPIRTALQKLNNNDSNLWHQTFVVQSATNAALARHKVVDTFADLLLVDPNSADSVETRGYWNRGDGGHSVYFATNTIAGTNAQGGRVLALGGSRSWQLANDKGPISVLQFGATPFDAVDDTAAITNCIAFAGVTPVVFPKGRFYVNQTIHVLPNTTAGIGLQGRNIRGAGFTGTSVTNNPLSFEGTTIYATHRNPIWQVAGQGVFIDGFTLMYSTFPTASDTSADAFRADGGELVMSEISNIRYINGYRAIHLPNNGGQTFSGKFRNQFILGFRQDGIYAPAPGTQGIWENVYITCNQEGASRPNYNETTTSISTSGTQCIFNISPDYAAFFTAGMLVNISGCDNAALNGNHSVVDVGATSITIEFPATVSPAPTTATINKLGGGAQVDGYAIYADQYREDQWINLNVEWMRFKNGQGLRFGDRTTIVGLHLEGLEFGSDSFSSGVLVRGLGSLTVVGWDLFNSWTRTNQNWSVFGPGSTNANVTVLGGRMRDQYYNPTSTLAVVGTTAGLPSDRLYYDNVADWNTSRHNRSGVFNGINYGKKIVGSDSVGRVDIGSASAGTVLSLTGNAAGVRALQMVRSGVTTVGYGVTTDGVVFQNETAGLGIAQWTGTASANNLVLGTGYSTTSPTLTISGATSTGTDVAPGTLTISPPSGTGNAATGGSIGFATPDAGASGTTPQTRTTKVTISKVGNLVLTTAGQGLQLKEGSNARMGTAVLVGGSVTVANTSVTANSRIFVTSNADGGTPGSLRISARSAGTSFTITSSSGTDTSTVAWVMVEPSP